jgi:hypothetical protein
VFVERAAVNEYLALRGIESLDPKRYAIADDVRPTDVQKFKELENRYNGQEEDDAA